MSVNWACSITPILADSKSTSVGMSHTLCQFPGRVKNQMAMSHSSTEAEVISFEHWFENGRIACVNVVGYGD